MTPPRGAGARTRLPAEQRRAQILAGAATLFQQRGYAGVGIDDIGAAVGISGPAVYRHVPGKEALVAEIGTGLLDRLLIGSREIVGAAATPEEALDRLVRFSVAECAEHTAALTVCLRHLWGLSDALTAEVTRRWTELGELWVPVVAATRPGLDPADRGLYVRAAGGILIGAERPAREVPTDRMIELLSAATLQLLGAHLAHPLEDGDARSGGGWTRSSRREQILGTAMRLFRERGYGGVSMAEIAEAVGVTASASYRHFRNKEDLLAVAVTRAGDRINAGITEALAQASSAEDALDRLIRSYVQICVENSDLIGVAVTEYYHLPSEARAQRRRRTKLFVEEWRHCLTTIRPDLTTAEADMLIAAVQGLVTESVRSSSLARRPQLAEDLYRLAHAALRAP